MEINKKLIKHSIILRGIIMLLFVTLTYLDYFYIIDIKNIALKVIIFLATEIFCISYYAFINSVHLIRNSTKDCVILCIITLTCLPEYLIAGSFNGVHQSVGFLSLGIIMSLALHCIASHLEYIEEDKFVTDRKYALLIKPLQYWGNLMLVMSFAVGFVGCFVTRIRV